jgi:hypothetical protein
VSVPLLGGGSAGIRHNSVSHAEKTLGAMTSPDCNSRAEVRMIQDNAQQWVKNVQNGKLHRRNIWFLLKFQLCPQIIYGLCSSTATFNEMSNCLRQQYYQILPLGGVVRTTTIASQTIDSGFYGIGLPHLGVEALPCRTSCSCTTGATQRRGVSCEPAILCSCWNWGYHYNRSKSPSTNTAFSQHIPG